MANTSIGQIPNNIDAEEAVIGSILIDSDCIDKVGLSPNDFFSSSLGYIYSVLMDMHEAGIGINEITVAEALYSRPMPGNIKTQLDDVGGAAYIVHLISITPTSLDAEYYAAIVRKCSFYRALIGCGSQIAALGFTQNDDPSITLDKAETILQGLRRDIIITRRSIEITLPRLLQTSPPRYIWNVNGKDIRLHLAEITQWGKFKNRIISELNFVPIKPRDWDSTINKLLAQSHKIEAPADASEEQQLKITILKRLTQMGEASVYSDLSIGRHILRDIDSETYYCFQSTPLLDHLKKDHKKASSDELWSTIEKWGAKRHQFSMVSSGGKYLGARVWCLPMNFCEYEEDKERINVPDDF